MVAVPILARAGDVIGVVVLHTEAPREFDDDVLNFLVHTASLVAGAIENAQLYEEARRRVDALTTLTELSQSLAAVTLREDLYDAVTRGARQLLGADACQIWRLDPRGRRAGAGRRGPARRDAAAAPGRAALLLDLMRREQRRRGASGVRGAGRRTSGLLLAPLVAGDEQLGILSCVARGRSFGAEDAELLRRRGQPDRGRAQEGRADRAADGREHRQGHVRRARGRRGPDGARRRPPRRAATSSRPHVFVHAERAPGDGPTGRPGRSWRARVQARLAAALPARFLRRAPRRAARAGAAADGRPERGRGAARRLRRARARGGAGRSG